jgi:hypothetical protein
LRIESWGRSRLLNSQFLILNSPAASPRGRSPTWLPLLHADQMRLPGPMEAEGLSDFEAQWREFWTGPEDEDP